MTGRNLDTGVYSVFNKVNGKRYVGSAAVSLGRRLKQHLNRLRAGAHRNRHLQAAWDKYGEEAFDFLVIEHCRPADCLTREQTWMDFYRSAEREFGYNGCPVAGSSLGIKRSAETRAKVAAANRGKKYPPEVRAKLSAMRKGRPATWLAGRTLSEEHRAAIGAANKGRKKTEEHKAKIGAANKGKLKGRELRGQHRERVIAANKSRETMTAETRARIAESRRLSLVKKAASVLSSLPRDAITGLQLRVLTMTAEGQTDSSIAEALSCGVGTVRGIRHRTYTSVRRIGTGAAGSSEFRLKAEMASGASGVDVFVGGFDR